MGGYQEKNTHESFFLLFVLSVFMYQVIQEKNRTLNTPHTTMPAVSATNTSKPPEPIQDPAFRYCKICKGYIPSEYFHRSPWEPFTCAYHSLCRDDIPPELKQAIIRLYGRFKGDCRNIYKIKAGVLVPKIVKMVKDGEYGDPWSEEVFTKVNGGYLVLKDMEKGADVDNIQMVDKSTHKKMITIAKMAGMIGHEKVKRGLVYDVMNEFKDS